MGGFMTSLSIHELLHVNYYVINRTVYITVKPINL